MPLGDAFQDSTDKALEVLASRPLDPEPPAPKHSAWSVIPRAMAAAGAEIGGNVMDIAGAYGQVAAATGVNDNPWDSVTGRNKEVTLSSLITGVPEDKHRKEQLALYEKLKTDGIDWRQEEGRQAYSFARDLRPDPQTAGTAEQIFFGLGKGLTKAISGGVLLGPVAGAGAFGTSEGMTTAEDLAVQGVDQATRTKVGAVTGLVTAAGMALPVAGQTLKQTAALVAVGGPGSFVAQQAASRAILENADYAEQAQQFDPLDPTGLALATLLPAGFAAYAKRGGFAKPAKPGEPPKITPDEADAVMVHNLTAAADAHEAADPAPFVKAMEEANPPSLEVALGKPIYIGGRDPRKVTYSLRDDGRLYREIEYADGEKRIEFLVEDKDGIDRTWVGDSSYSDNHFPVQHSEANALLEAKADADSLGYKQEAQPMSLIDSELNAQKGGDPFGQEGQGRRQEVLTDRPADQSPADPRLEAIKAEQPDLPVRVSDDGTPIRLADELEAAKKLAQEGADDSLGLNDAPLLKVAAECFLSLGATAG